MSHPSTRPNILVVMVDQLNGTLFPDGPADWLHAPNLNALAERSVRFGRAYTASPLCAPARAAFMSGCLPSRTGVYDNAAEMPSAVPTWAHHLRRAGYRTCLTGKMHFVGPDQLHGFEERTTTDVYPADFGWTPDYRAPLERVDWWYHNLGSVVGAGVAEITNQLEYDDEVAHHARQWLHQRARERDDGPRPWALCVSFTHPHDPYVARREHWDLYEGCEHLLPPVGPLPFEALDAHSRRLMESFDYERFPMTEADVMRSRRAYFANVSYLDGQIGSILRVLEATGQREDTVVVFTSDHGDMLGSHGLWFKMSFREGSARVPLMIDAPGVDAASVAAPVSTLDVAPTLCALAGANMDAVAAWTDGERLIAPDGTAAPRPGPVPMEYTAEGSVAPLVSLVDGPCKLNVCDADPPELYDLADDPHELTNLAADPAHADTFERLSALAAGRWNLAAFDAAVRESQARRHLVYDALRNGEFWPWDFQPIQRAAERYMRNHMDLNVVEERNRYPRGVQPKP